MYWDSAVVPLAVAAVGAVAVAIGAWMAARSALRSRLIDVFREDEKERSAFHLRTVRAVGQLVMTGWTLIDGRINFLEELIAGTSSPTSSELIASQDAAALAAAEAWRSVFDEAHVFAAGELFDAMQAFDDKRRDLAAAVNAASTLPDMAEVVAALKDAKRVSDELGQVAGLSVYLHLQQERMAYDSRLYYVGHAVSLRRFAKFIDDERRRGLKTVQERIRKLDGSTST